MLNREKMKMRTNGTCVVACSSAVTLSENEIATHPILGYQYEIHENLAPEIQLHTQNFLRSAINAMIREKIVETDGQTIHINESKLPSKTLLPVWGEASDSFTLSQQAQEEISKTDREDIQFALLTIRCFEEFSFQIARRISTYDMAIIYKEPVWVYAQ